MCPALSARRHCPLSRCQRMAIVILSAHQAATADMQAAPPCSGRILPQQTPVMLAALNPTRTRWTGHLARPTVCRHTTRWRTSCGPPEVAAGIGLGAMFGCVRHCRGNDPHGSPNAEPYAYVWHRYIRIVGRGQRQHVQQAAHRCYRWQPSPYSHSRGDIGRSCQYPPVLCALIYYAHRITNERA